MAYRLYLVGVYMKVHPPGLLVALYTDSTTPLRSAELSNPVPRGASPEILVKFTAQTLGQVPG